MAFEFRLTTVATSTTPNAATVFLPRSTVVVSKRGAPSVETPFVYAQKPTDGVEIVFMDATTTGETVPQPTKTPSPVVMNNAFATPNNLTFF